MDTMTDQPIPQVGDSDRGEMNDIVDHLNAWCDEDERVARVAGESRIAWLTYRDDEGQMLYTTVAAEAADGAWVAAGSEVPAPASALVVYDPARVQADVEVIRKVINDYRMSDGAILRALADGQPVGRSEPGWAGIYAGRDAFASVLRAYAETAGWKRERTEQ